MNALVAVIVTILLIAVIVGVGVFVSKKKRSSKSPPRTSNNVVTTPVEPDSNIRNPSQVVEQSMSNNEPLVSVEEYIANFDNESFDEQLPLEDNNMNESLTVYVEGLGDLSINRMGDEVIVRNLEPININVRNRMIFNTNDIEYYPGVDIRGITVDGSQLILDKEGNIQVITTDNRLVIPANSELFIYNYNPSTEGSTETGFVNRINSVWCNTFDSEMNCLSHNDSRPHII